MNDKMKAYWARHDRWKKERDEVVLSYDVEKFKKFYEKWRKEGFYTGPLPDDDLVIEISMRQCVLALKDVPQEKADEARKWLKEHGCSPDPWKG